MTLLVAFSVADSCKLLACVIAFSLLQTASASAQQSQDLMPSGQVHYLLNTDLPPGAIGQARLMGRGPVHSYYQPIQIECPKGASVALATAGGFTRPEPDTVTAGLMVGVAYRFQITGIPDQPGVEIFPSVEVIDRIYPPPGQATSFPIPVHIDEDDIKQALEGRLVTRVVYLEDPQTALPLADEPGTQRSFDIRPDMDPLKEADRLGRPVAIVRIGSRVPPRDPGQLHEFLLGNPPWLEIPKIEIPNLQGTMPE